LYQEATSPTPAYSRAYEAPEEALYQEATSPPPVNVHHQHVEDDETYEVDIEAEYS